MEMNQHAANARCAEEEYNTTLQAFSNPKTKCFLERI